MKVTKPDPAERDALISALSEMPAYMEASFSDLSREMLCRNGPDGGFSPIEQVWHMADLEEEGFFPRIAALLEGRAGYLADFDGDRIARERNYKSLPFSDGLEKFKRARDRNINLFRILDDRDWMNEGYLEGVGNITLRDMPSFLLQHDAAHTAEIETWKTINAPAHTGRGGL